MDCLLQQLRLSGYGCHIENVFAGAFGYADDLVLLAPSRACMNKLLRICYDFSNEYQI